MSTLEQRRRSDQRFDAGLECLRRYTREHGTTWVPDKTVVDGFALGTWTAARRADARAGRLRPDRQALLDAEFPGWRDRARLRFTDGMAATRRHRDLHGHSRADTDTVIDGFPLGRWQRGRRQEHRAGRLPRWQYTQITTEFPDWDWSAERDYRTFDEIMTLLRQYGAEHGHTRVPTGAHYRGVALGARVTAYRSRHRNRTLTAQQITALESLPGWEWDAHEARLEDAVAALYRYTSIHHTHRVPRSAVVNGFRIGDWCRSRRAEYFAGRLNPVVRDRLQDEFPQLWTHLTARTRPAADTDDQWTSAVA